MPEGLQEYQLHEINSRNGTKPATFALRRGIGHSIAQHGELFQGQIEDDSGALTRCLLSLPCRSLSSTAEFTPDDSGTVIVFPPHKTKAKTVVELTLAYFTAHPIGGVLHIRSSIPEAKGYGSSTADCVASVLSVADALHSRLSEEEIARLVVEAEVASDNFMFRSAVLFAHRNGIVLEDYGKDVPPLDVVGVDAAEDELVDTLRHPPAVYSWQQIQSFRTLSCALGRAIRTGDTCLLGRVATASARINEQFLPKPRFRELLNLAEQSGALGVSVAHSGTILSVLFDSRDPLLEQKRERLERGVDQLGITNTFRFRT
jgi:uncharacterized protein involved in propanediol utilization